MPVREFNGTTDVLWFAQGAGDITGAVTIALMFWPKAAGTTEGIYESVNGKGELKGYGVFKNSSQCALEIDNGEPGSERQGFSGVGELLTSESWGLMVVTRPAGTAKCKWYRMLFANSPAKWTTAESGSTLVAPSSMNGGKFDIGGGADGFFFKGKVAAVGRWDKALTESEVHKLGVTLKGWSTLSPKFHALLNQAGVGEEVLDLSGNGGSQIERSGTTVVAEEPPIPYEGIGYVGEGVKGFAESTTLEVPKPADVIAGDLMLMEVYLTLTGVAIASAGWTVVGEQKDQSTTYRNALLSKIDDGTAGPYTVTWNGTKHGCEAVIAAYRGCHQTTPVNAQSASVNASSTTLKCATITPTATNCRIVQFGVESVGQAATPAASFLERHDNTATDGMHIADIFQAGKEATGEKNFTLGSAGTSIGRLIALAPAEEAAAGTSLPLESLSKHRKIVNP